MTLRPFDEVAMEMAKGPWRKERRVGVEHFATGQVRAEPAADDNGDRCWVLAFAPAEGHSILVLPIDRVDDKWVHHKVAFRFRSSGVQLEHLQHDFALTLGLTNALDLALQAEED